MSLKCSFLGIHNDQTQTFRGQLIALATIAAIMSFPIAALNFRIWTKVLVTRHLHHPAYIIIANLAITDWLAGCIGLPCFAGICVTQIGGDDPCKMAFTTIPALSLLGAATFSAVNLQALERYIAIFYPFFYKAWFTNSVIIIANVIMWLLSTSLTLFWVLSRNLTVYRILMVIIVVILISVDIFCYLKIYWETKKIEKHIAVQTSVSNSC